MKNAYKKCLFENKSFDNLEFFIDPHTFIPTQTT